MSRRDSLLEASEVDGMDELELRDWRKKRDEETERRKCSSSSCKAAFEPPLIKQRQTQDLNECGRGSGRLSIRRSMSALLQVFSIAVQ